VTQAHRSPSHSASRTLPPAAADPFHNIPTPPYNTLISTFLFRSIIRAAHRSAHAPPAPFLPQSLTVCLYRSAPSHLPLSPETTTRPRCWMRNGLAGIPPTLLVQTFHSGVTLVTSPNSSPTRRIPCEYRSGIRQKGDPLSRNRSTADQSTFITPSIAI